MGKTHFAQNSLADALKSSSRDKKQNVYCIHNDEIRKECLDRWIRKNPESLINQGVKQTSEEAVILFRERVNENLLRIIKDSTS